MAKKINIDRLYEKLALTLRLHMAAKNLSTIELANKSKLHRHTVRVAEQSKMTLETLLTVCNALGVRPSIFIEMAERSLEEDKAI